MYCKKNINRIFLFLIFSILCLFCAISIFMGTNIAYASTEKITQNNYSKDYMFDSSLFNVMLALAKQLNCNQPFIAPSGFYVDYFLSGYKTEPSYVNNIDMQTQEDYSKNVEDRNVIVNDLDNGILNLTTGDKAKYDCLKKVKNPIKNLEGLNSLYLSNITTLILDNNNITEVKDTHFETLNNLTTLSIKNNNLKSFELNSSITKLNNLDLSGNKLTSIDLTLLNSSVGNYPIVNLSSNNFSDVEKIITLSTNKDIQLAQLSLSLNKFDNLTLEEIELLNDKVVGDGIADLGVQGLNKDKYIAGDEIIIYNNEYSTLNNINIEIYYDETSEFFELGKICETQNEENIKSIKLPAGKIKIKFKNNDTYINNISEIGDDLKNIYADKSLSVALPKLNSRITVNNKVIESVKHEDDFNVEFYLDFDNFPNVDDVINNSKIFSTANNIYSEKASILINYSGTHNCVAYIQFDGINSDYYRINVIKENKSGQFWGILIVVSALVLSFATFYIFRWLREGASVAPLSEKELYKLKRKQSKNNFEVQDQHFRGLNRSRQFQKLKDNVDEISENLNEKNNVVSHYNNNEDDYKEESYLNSYNYIQNSFDRYNQEQTRNDFAEYKNEDDNLESDDEITENLNETDGDQWDI